MKTYCFLAFAIKNGKEYTTPVRIHGHGDLEEAVEMADLSIAIHHEAHAYAMLYFKGEHSLEDLRCIQVPEFDQLTSKRGSGWHMFILDQAVLQSLDRYPKEKGDENYAK